MLKVVTSILIFTIFSACTKKATSPYRTALLGAPTLSTYDPAVVESYNMTTLFNQICGRLVLLAPDMSIEGDLAKSWTINKTEHSYTFHIDTSRKFFNGKKVVLDDIIFSLNRSRTQSQTGWLSDVKEIKRIGQEKIKIKLSASNPRFLYQLTTPNACILSKKTPFLSINETLMPNSAGAYKVSKVNNAITLTKNPFYPKKQLEDIIEVFFYSQEEAIEAFKDGELHDLSFFLLSDSELNTIKTKTSLDSRVFWAWSILLNPSSQYFSIYRNRQIFIESLDRDSIIGHWGASIFPGDDLPPKGMNGHISGYLNGKAQTVDFCKRPLTGALIKGIQLDHRLKTSIEKNIKHMTKCTARVDILSMDTWSKAYRSKKYDFYVAGLDTNSSDPLGFYRYFIEGFKENILEFRDKNLSQRFSMLYNKSLKQRGPKDLSDLAKAFKETYFAFIIGYPHFSFVYAPEVTKAHINPLGMHMNRWWEIGRE